MPFCFSEPCDTVSNAIDAVNLEIPKGYAFWELESTQSNVNMSQIIVPKTYNAQFKWKPFPLGEA